MSDGKLYAPVESVVAVTGVPTSEATGQPTGYSTAPPEASSRVTVASGTGVPVPPAPSVARPLSEPPHWAGMAADTVPMAVDGVRAPPGLLDPCPVAENVLACSISWLIGPTIAVGQKG